MAELERLVKLLQTSKATAWRIETRAGVKKGSFEGETTDETIEAFEERYSSLFPDTYVLKYRDKTKTNEKGQDSETFVIKKNEEYNRPQTPTLPKMDGEFTKYLLEVAQKLGKIETEFEYMKRDYSELKETVKTLSSQMLKVYDELTDEDKTNDKSALEKLGEMANHLPKIAEGMKSFRDLKA